MIKQCLLIWLGLLIAIPGYATDVNMCLAVNGGALEDSAGEWHRDNDFNTSGDYVDGHGGSAAAYLYIKIAGSWTYLTGYSGSGNPGWSWATTPTVGTTITGPWSDVTGIRIVLAGPSAGTKSITFPSATISYVIWGTSGNGNADVARGYSMEMQAWGYIENTNSSGAVLQTAGD